MFLAAVSVRYDHEYDRSSGLVFANAPRSDTKGMSSVYDGGVGWVVSWCARSDTKGMSSVYDGGVAGLWVGVLSPGI